MRVPTLVSERGIYTGSTGPSADAESFGLGVARGTAQLGKAIGSFQQPVEQIAAVNAHKKLIDDNDWVATSLSQEQMHLLEMMNDPKINSREDFPEWFKQYASEREKIYVEKAPSPRAAQTFRREFLQNNVSLYNAALKTAADTKVSNLNDAVVTQTENAINGWRTALTVPGVDAGQVLLDSLDNVNRAADSSFGSFAPEHAKKLKDEATVQAAYATADTSPELAKEILKRSKTLDERTRATILNHIETAENSRDSANRILFNQRRDDMLANAEMGKFGGKIDESIYSLFYPDAQGHALKSRDDAIYDAYQSAQSNLETLAPLNGGAMSRELQKIVSSASGEAGKLKVTVLTQKLAKIVELQEKDPAAWQRAYNPQVKSALQRAPLLPDNSYDYSEAYELMAKYQGVPEESDKDKDLFLYKPARDLNLLTLAEADDTVNRIHNGKPTEALAEMEKFVNQFPTKFQSAAFNNLVTLPSKGLKQEYQLAFLNRDQMWVKDYLGAISKTDFSKFTEDTRRDFNSALMSDPTFTRFAQMFKREGLQGGPDIEGFRSGILSYAYAKSFSEGKSFSKAVAEASDELLNSEMGAANVNGRDFWIMRKREGSNYRRNDQEVAGLGARMQALIQTVPVDRVALVGHDKVPLFPALEGLPSEKSKREKLYQAIQTNGIWVSDPDGQGGTLYYNDGRHPFQLTTTDYKPLGVRFSEVEQDGWFKTAVTAKAPGSFGSSSEGFSGMGNLFNPWSQFNIVNMVYGTGGKGTKVGQGAALGLFGDFYIGKSTLYSTNWPVLVKPRE